MRPTRSIAMQNALKMAVAVLALLALAGVATVPATASSAAAPKGQDAADASGRTNVPNYLRAPTCCPNCSTAPANCCCAPPKKPATLTRFAATKTVTVVVTKTTLKALVPQRRSLTDDVADAAIAAAGSDTSESLGITMEHSIKERSVPRNLCPVCPKGAAVSGKNNGNAKPVYCCPARKTVTKTLKKTLTIKKTKTKTVTGVKKATISGRIFYDVDGNGVFKAPPDVPLSNTLIYLVRTTAKKNRLLARAEVPLANTTTNANGLYSMEFVAQSPGQLLALVQGNPGNAPLVTFKAGADGGATNSVPVTKPSPATGLQTLVSANVATVSGTASPNTTVIVKCGAIQCGTGTVTVVGTFSVLTNLTLHSGSTTISVTLVDGKGLESDPASGPAAVIPAAPVIISTVLNGRTATITGTGQAGATVKITELPSGTVFGTAAVAPNGTFSVKTSTLVDGVHTFTATQEDSKGVSDSVPAGSVTVVPPTTTKAAASTTARPSTTLTTMTLTATTTSAKTTTVPCLNTPSPLPNAQPDIWVRAILSRTANTSSSTGTLVQVKDVTLLPNGDAIAIGEFFFNLTMDCVQLEGPTNNKDVFVFAFDGKTGNTKWGKRIGGLDDGWNDFARAVVGDANGVYAVTFVNGFGNTSVDGLSATCTAVSGVCGFLTKLDPETGTPAWIVAYDTTGNTNPIAAAIDPTSGHIYIAGTYYKQNTTIGGVPVTGVFASGDNAFLAKMDSTTGSAIWTTSLLTSQSGSGGMNLYTVASTGAKLAVGGKFTGGNVTSGAFTLVGTDQAGVKTDPFVATLDPSTGSVTAMISFQPMPAGEAQGETYGVAYSMDGNTLFASGKFGKYLTSGTYLVTGDTNATNPSNFNSMFLVKMDSGTLVVSEAQAYGGPDGWTEPIFGNNIAVDNSTNVWMVGQTISTNVTFGSNSISVGDSYANTEVIAQISGATISLPGLKGHGFSLPTHLSDHGGTGVSYKNGAVAAGGFYGGDNFTVGTVAMPSNYCVTKYQCNSIGFVFKTNPAYALP